MIERYSSLKDLWIAYLNSLNAFDSPLVSYSDLRDIWQEHEMVYGEGYHEDDAKLTNFWLEVHEIQLRHRPVR